MFSCSSVAAACFIKIRHKFVRNALRICQPVNATPPLGLEAAVGLIINITELCVMTQTQSPAFT